VTLRLNDSSWDKIPILSLEIKDERVTRLESCPTTLDRTGLWSIAHDPEPRHSPDHAVDCVIVDDCERLPGFPRAGARRDRAPVDAEQVGGGHRQGRLPGGRRPAHARADGRPVQRQRRPQPHLRCRPPRPFHQGLARRGAQPDGQRRYPVLRQLRDRTGQDRRGAPRVPRGQDRLHGRAAQRYPATRLGKRPGARPAAASDRPRRPGQDGRPDGFYPAEPARRGQVQGLLREREGQPQPVRDRWHPGPAQGGPLRRGDAGGAVRGIARNRTLRRSSPGPWNPATAGRS